jgi:aryl-alcohol dehydrogenase-like predicted oxidoreductase
MESKQLEPDYSKMDYRHLGKTGLKVSVLGYGNWLNSNNKAAYDFTKAAIKECLSLGINFYDTAEIYGMGEAESQMGQAFKDLNVRRESIVVSTKIWKVSGTGLNDTMMSRKHIVEGL